VPAAAEPFDRILPVWLAAQSGTARANGVSSAVGTGEARAGRTGTAHNGGMDGAAGDGFCLVPQVRGLVLVANLGAISLS
jgi:hypothetical protein